jgi:hypothetical protein
LNQAGPQWKAKLNEVMKGLNFDKSQANDCLYILWEGDEVVMLVLVYVDNMAMAGKDLNRIQKKGHLVTSSS